MVWYGMEDVCEGARWKYREHCRYTNQYIATLDVSTISFRIQVRHWVCCWGLPPTARTQTLSALAIIFALFCVQPTVGVRARRLA